MTFHASRITLSSRRHPLAIALALSLALPAAASAAPALDHPLHRSPTPSATTWPVTRCDDDGSAGTLRSVVAGAASGDTVDLSQLACSTITLTQGEIVIAQDALAIAGPGAAVLTVDAGGASRVFDHQGSGQLSIDALGLANGYSNASGGCVYTAGSLYLDEVTLSGCVASGASTYGGGADVVGSAMVVGSRVTGSTAYCGGGLSVSGDFLLIDSTVAYNRATTAQTAYNAGGGIFAAGSSVSITRSTISGNHSDFTAGGLYVGHHPSTQQDLFSMVDSTLSGNAIDVSRGQGAFSGAMIIMASSQVANSTIAFNQHVGNGCGLYFGNSSIGYYSNADLESSIIAGNVGTTLDSPACDLSTTGIFVSLTGANNLVQVNSYGAPPPPDTIATDPMLLPLADNGGPTWTHALLPGSPAIDIGNNLLALDTDQRGTGYPRVYGAAADIGAYEMQQGTSVPTLSKHFTPAAIMIDSISTVTLTLGNGGASADTLSADLVDALPTPLVVANPSNASTTCPGGTIDAAPGSDSVRLAAGAQIPAQGTCTVNVSVIAHTTGSFTNVIAAGALQTDGGDSPDPASAVLTVSGQPIAPTLTKSFAPGTIAAGGSSTLTLVLANAHANAATLTADLVDALPPPLVVADPPLAATTCPGGSVTAAAGAGSVALAAGAQIPGGTCTVSVAVTSASPGEYLNTIAAGALQTDFGNSPDAANAGLIVTPGGPIDRIFADGFDVSAP